MRGTYTIFVKATSLNILGFGFSHENTMRIEQEFYQDKTLISRKHKTNLWKKVVDFKEEMVTNKINKMQLSSLFFSFYLDYLGSNFYRCLIYLAAILCGKFDKFHCWRKTMYDFDLSK